MVVSRQQAASWFLVMTFVVTSLYLLSYQNLYSGFSNKMRNFQLEFQRFINDSNYHSTNPLESYNDDFQKYSAYNPKQPVLQNYTLLHEERIRHLKEVCNDKELFSNRTYRGVQSLEYYYSKEYNFAYCKVPKSGCTFWTQVFMVLNNYSVEETFGLRRAAVHGRSGRFSITSYSLKIKKPRMVLVSRDPYSRIYSGFIDKVYLGLFPIYRTRIRDSPAFCNFDITFDSFLRYIINRARGGYSLNRHWAPIFSLCKPCEVNQYKLVKQETFSKDVELVLKDIKLETSKYKAITDALHDHRADVTIPGIVETVYLINRRQRDVMECIGISGLAKRLWISFQIQGFIDKRLPFPDYAFENEGAHDNFTKLSELILHAASDHPLTSAESKQQRHEFLVSAYRSASEESIRGIQEVYKPDFELFDYDINPPV